MDHMGLALDMTKRRVMPSIAVAVVCKFSVLSTCRSLAPLTSGPRRGCITCNGGILEACHFVRARAGPNRRAELGFSTVDGLLGRVVVGTGPGRVRPARCVSQISALSS